MSDKKNGLGEGSIEIGDTRYGTFTFVRDKTRYTIRELSADESDEQYEAAKQPDGSTSVRMSNRLLLAKAMVEPVLTVEQVGKLGNRTYTALVVEFNKLNNLTEENPTSPAGSAGPTSPSSGEASPQP